MKMQPKTTVLLLGDHRYALTFVRSLSAAGYRVLVGDAVGKRHAANSRCASGFWLYPAITGRGEAFIAALTQYLRDNREVELLMPLGDTEVTTMAAYAAQLPASVRVAAPPLDAVNICANKAVMARIAHELNVPQAPFAVVRNRKELFSQASGIGFPCVARAGDGPRSIFGQKAVICSSAQELEAAFTTWPPGVDSLLLQAFASGHRYNVQLLAQNGELKYRVQTKTLRTDRPDYTGYTTESVTVPLNPEIDDCCRRLVRRLQYDGFGCAQFLVDEDKGTISFLEINVRLGAAFAISSHCGVDFPLMGAEQALSRNATLPRTQYKAGKRIVWSLGDLQGIIRARGAGQITRGQALRWAGSMCWSFVHADMHTTWSWRDPRPTLMAYAALVSQLGRAALARFRPTNRPELAS